MRSANFLAVSVLSSCHPPLLLPGCGGSAPCAISGHDVSLQPENQAARANCWLAILFFAPFNDSEQIGSHARPPELMSKPVSPNNVNALTSYREGWGIVAPVVASVRCRRRVAMEARGRGLSENRS